MEGARGGRGVVGTELGGPALTADGRAGRAPSYVSLLPAEPGVYRFRDVGDRALYIGRTADLRRRVPPYWGSLRDRRRLRRMVRNIAGVEALVCASEHEAAWLERNLLEHRKPNEVRQKLTPAARSHAHHNTQLPRAARFCGCGSADAVCDVVSFGAWNSACSRSGRPWIALSPSSSLA